MAGLLNWLLLGLSFGLLLWPYQAMSELGFRLQRALWLAPRPEPLIGCLLVFAATTLLILLAWGPLAGGRGGGVTPLLALDRTSPSPSAALEQRWLQQLSLATQLRRLPLLLLTHIVGQCGGRCPRRTLARRGLEWASAAIPAGSEARRRPVEAVIDAGSGVHKPGLGLEGEIVFHAAGHQALIGTLRRA